MCDICLKSAIFTDIPNTRSCVISVLNPPKTVFVTGALNDDYSFRDILINYNKSEDKENVKVVLPHGFLQGPTGPPLCPVKRTHRPSHFLYLQKSL